MKNQFFLALVFAVLVACQTQPAPDHSADEAFNKNAATAMAVLKGFQAENVDYSVYSSEFTTRDTGFGPEKEYTLNQMIENDKNLWAGYDFKLIGIDTLVLLPGVDIATKKPDGSVRYYGDWEVTRAATDSTEAKTGILKAYEFFNFNSEGKIVSQQIFGDFTGLFMYLNSN